MGTFDLDLLARSLTAAGSRRTLLSIALAGVLATLRREGTEAKRKPCPPCKKRKQGKCKAKLRDGTPCPGGSCQGGGCVATVAPDPLPRCQPTTCTAAGVLCGHISDGCGATLHCTSNNVFEYIGMVWQREDGDYIFSGTWTYFFDEPWPPDTPGANGCCGIWGYDGTLAKVEEDLTVGPPLAAAGEIHGCWEELPF